MPLEGRSIVRDSTKVVFELKIEIEIRTRGVKNIIRRSKLMMENNDSHNNSNNYNNSNSHSNIPSSNNISCRCSSMLCTLGVADKVI